MLVRALNNFIPATLKDNPPWNDAHSVRYNATLANFFLFPAPGSPWRNDVGWGAHTKRNLIQPSEGATWKEKKKRVIWATAAAGGGAGGGEGACSFPIWNTTFVKERPKKTGLLGFAGP